MSSLAARLPDAARRGDRRRRPRHQHGSRLLGRGRRSRCRGRVRAGRAVDAGSARPWSTAWVAPPARCSAAASARWARRARRRTETFDAEDLLKALRAGLDGSRGSAPRSEGDKTIVDAFAPALQAFERELRAGRDVGQACPPRGRGREGGDRARRSRCRRGRAGPPTWGRGAWDIRIRAPPPRRCCSPRSAQGRRTAVVTADRLSRRGTIQSVDRAARILKALGYGHLAAGRHRDRRSARAGEGHGLRPAPHARGPGAGRTGPRDRQVPPRAGDAPARQRVPGQPRAPRPVAAVGRLPGLAGRRGRARRGAARAERA